MEPIEYKAFRTLYHQLHTGISSGLEDLVSPAYSEKLISDRVHQAVCCPLKDRGMRTSEFLNAIHMRVKVLPSAFDVFLDILSQDRAHDYLADRLRDERAKEKEVEREKHRRELALSEIATFRKVPTTTLRTSPVIERPLKNHAPFPFQRTEPPSPFPLPKASSEERYAQARTRLGRYRLALTPPGTHSRTLVSGSYEHEFPGRARPVAGPARQGKTRGEGGNRSERNSEPVVGISSDCPTAGTPTDPKKPSITHTAPTPTTTGAAVSSVKDETPPTEASEGCSKEQELLYLCVRTRQLSIESVGSSQSSEEDYHSALSSLEDDLQFEIGQPIQETVAQGQSAVTATPAGDLRTSIDIKQSQDLALLLQKAHEELSKMKQREDAFVRERDKLQAKVEHEKERRKEFQHRFWSSQAKLSDAEQWILKLGAHLQALYQEIEQHKVKSYAFDVVRKNDELQERMQRLENILTLNGIHLGCADEL